MRNFLCNIVLLCFFLLTVSCAKEMPAQKQASQAALAYQPGNTLSTFIQRIQEGDIVNPLATLFDPLIYGALTPQDFGWGGMLYSAWWASDGAGTLDATLIPATDNPSWIPTGNILQTGKETWRCSACHGWDYTGADGQFGDPAHPNYSGFFGILTSANYSPQTSGNPAATFDVIDTGTLPDARIIPDHAFGALTNNPNAIYALTLFVENIRNEAIAVYPGSEILGSPQNVMANLTIVADQADGLDNYTRDTPNTAGTNTNRQGGCNEGCHGDDGSAIVISAEPAAPKTITTSILADPFKALHKIRFGQPGAAVPMAGLDWYDNRAINRRTSQVVALNILAYGRDGLFADHARGGRLFDNWILETGLDAPAIPNPLASIRDPNPGDILPDQQWLCSACHGFDYQGVAGFQNNLVELKILRDWNLEYLYSYLKNGRMAFVGSSIVPDAHSFAMQLPDAEVWNLAEFLMEGVIDTNQYVAAGLGGRGLGEGIGLDGDEHYNGNMSRVFSAPAPWACVECHSDAGNGVGAGAIVAQPPTVNIFAASWNNTNAPWRFFHRTRFGMPGLYDLDGDGMANERMPGLTEIVLAERRDPTVPANETSNLSILTSRSMDILTYAQEMLSAQVPLFVESVKTTIVNTKSR